jgi:hypothetical protein
MYSHLKVFIFLIFVVAICYPVFAFKFASTWTPPDVQPVDFTGKKIVVLVLGRNLQKCLAAEEDLAREITARGAQGIAGHTLISENELSDKEKVKSDLAKAGVAGAVVIRAWIKGQQSAGPDQDRGFWKFYGETMETDSGQPPENVDLYVETRVYSIDQDKMMWTGSSSTKSSKLEKFIQELVPAIGEAMNKQGLLKR